MPDITDMFFSVGTLQCRNEALGQWIGLVNAAGNFEFF
jgi:hypothetical protein